MSFPATAVPTTKNATTNGVRPTANYHPTLWKDDFLAYDSTSKATDGNEAQFEELKEEVRRILTNTMSDMPNSQKLRLIDAIERLGVAYHYKSEIEYALQKLGDEYHDIENDLCSTSLRFRLLRQKGINVSCDTFEKFKDTEGNFNASFIDDIPGMLSLYEAAHLGIKGEDILDEALAFTTKHLQSALAHVSTPLAEQIRRALNRPIRRCPPRLEARYYISAYSALEESYNETLLKFAKLDFNILQGLHQKELNGIMGWWKGMDVATNLPYARDRIVESYLWILGVFFEPQFSLARKILTKVGAILTTLDDTYDNYGTNEELELFTEAIQRWDIRAINSIPGYMKMFYHAIINLYTEIEEDIAEEKRPYCMHYAKEAIKRFVRFNNAEAKWRDEGYVPSLEEYMDVSLVTVGCATLITTAFLGMGDLSTKEAFEWVSNNPKIVRASAIIFRLMDDIMGHEFEQERKHVASSVECGMKKHGLPREEVVKFFRKDIANAWKDINEECLNLKEVPMPLLEIVLNFSRAFDVIYKDGDGYTNAHILKDDVASLLKDPVLL